MHAAGRTLVVKIGSSSVTTGDGRVDTDAIDKLAGEVAQARAAGHRVVIVTSGAIAAGWTTLAEGRTRPSDLATLQAVAAVGQHLLMRVWSDALGRHGLVAGQVLLAPLDFGERRQYLHARSTLLRLLELGVVPVVNENDAVADDEIRFGDNDRLAALVANLLGADLLVLLTDTPGLLSADPRRVADASLVEEVTASDRELERVAGGPGSPGGSGGMASKLAAARMAAWSGVRVVIAAADRPGVLADAVRGLPGTGTVVQAHERRLGARKLWIAFALPAAGRVLVPEGARRALVEHEASLLPVGVVAVEGEWSVGEAVEIAGPDGAVFAKGIASLPSARREEWMRRRTNELPEDLASEMVHRDNLVVLTNGASGEAPLTGGRRGR